MIHFTPCKINLGLHVVGKRSDGYHNIETCFFPVPWHDAVEIIPAQDDDVTFSLSGIPVPGDTNDNLVMKAYQLLSSDFSLAKISCHLHKVIPSGAGLGGGSSDGAAALLLLNNIFQLKLSPADLRAYASQLGSDCAFFIEGKPKIGREKGDVLEDIHMNLKGKQLVIVKPRVNVSTAEAYQNLRLSNRNPRIKQIIENVDLAGWSSLLTNDFEETVFEKYPEIGKMKASLYDHGAIYASMSGSGSAVFGIFDQPPQINGFDDCVVWTGTL